VIRSKTSFEVPPPLIANISYSNAGDKPWEVMARGGNQ